MAATSVLSAIPGLQRPLGSEDLELSRAVLFVRNGVQDVFGIHLSHNHFMAPKDTVLLGIEAQLSEKQSACWTEPVPVADLTNKAVHRHVFHIQTDGQFVPYELHEGEADAKAAGTGPEFFQKFARFLRENNLADLVALEVLDGTRGSTSSELPVGPQSTLGLDRKDLNGFGDSSITTGWSFQVGDDGIISCKGDTTYSPMVKQDTHKVFVGGKLLPSVQALKEALRKEGLIS